MVISSGRCTNRCECHARARSRLSATCGVFFGMLLLASFMGCDRAPAPAEERRAETFVGARPVLFGSRRMKSPGPV